MTNKTKCKTYSVIDMHLHTQDFSPDSVLRPKQILNALSPKITGIVITDHNVFNSNSYDILIHKYDIEIFKGAEVSSMEGDILVYGTTNIPASGLSAAKTIDLIHQTGGIAIAAHPFRILGLEDHIYDLDLDGIEINGSATKSENDLAQKAATMMNLPTIGGSDAHRIEQLNTYCTLFQKPVKSIQNIVTEIQRGNCKAVRIQ